MPYKDPDQQRKYQPEWRARRQKEWLVANGPCVRCASWENLQIDHKDPKKKVSHRIWSWAKERREKELAKCQVLCKKCHIEKSSEEKRRPIRHGTHSAYASGCRCLSCNKAHREYMKWWKGQLVTRYQ